MIFLKNMKNDVLTLMTDNSNIVKWKWDVSYAIHTNMKSHTSTYMILGRGAVTSVSKKQKLNTRSSTEDELVGSDDIMGDILWSQKFLEAQGYEVKHNILEQDNKSIIIYNKMEIKIRANIPGT